MSRHPLRAAAGALALLVAGCGGTPTSPQDAGAHDAGPQDAGPEDAGPADAGDGGDGDAGAAPIIQSRPYHSHVPAHYDASTPTPLLLMLHGYGASGPLEESYLRLAALSDSEGFLYAFPDGLLDTHGERFWNATDACCDFYGNPTDDVAYLSAVIDDMERRYNVDPHRIYVFGHSNGGFMANRLGCDLTERIAAFVSMAGESWDDPSRCHPSAPISMIQFQGTADATVLYDGGSFASGVPPYPGAQQTAADWAASDGCDGGIVDGGSVAVALGLGTTIARYGGCGQSGVELWTVQGGSHIPALDSGWGAPFWAFLSAHTRP